MENINFKKINFLKNRFKNNPKMLNVIDKCIEKYGDKAVYYLPFGGGNQTIVYPNILLTNGTLQQTYTAIGGSSSSPMIGTPRYIGSQNYNMGLQMSIGSQNSPSIYMCIFTQGSGSTQTTVPNFSSNNGVSFYITPGNGGGPSCNSIILSNGVTSSGSQGAGSLNQYLYIKEINGRLSVATGTTTPTYIVNNLDVSSYFNSNFRYIHVYQADGGISGATFTITQIQSII